MCKWEQGDSTASDEGREAGGHAIDCVGPDTHARHCFVCFGGGPERYGGGCNRHIPLHQVTCLRSGDAQACSYADASEVVKDPLWNCCVDPISQCAFSYLEILDNRLDPWRMLRVWP